LTTLEHETKSAGRNRVVLERAFTAPRELVFRMFTDPAHLVRWWVPYPLTMPVCEWDARPGGAIRLVMQLSEEKRWPSVGRFHEVDPPHRLVFSTGWDPDESDVPGTEVLQTVTFTERGDQTVVRLQIDVIKAVPTTPETLAGMEIGWMQDFGRLAFYLLSWTDSGDEMAPVAPSVTTPSDREIVLTRTFTGPRAPIFEALTDPAAVPHLWGPHQATRVETMDVRHLGKWRFLQQQPDGETRGYRGEYLLVVPPELVATTFESEAAAGQSRIDAVHLFERAGTTRLTSISLFSTPEERDSALAAGMADGLIERFERLEQLLPVRV
jgi:uncharacterized protein YndB with AHSA1/START domain